MACQGADFGVLGRRMHRQYDHRSGVGTGARAPSVVVCVGLAQQPSHSKVLLGAKCRNVNQTHMAFK